jgi:HK97 family phage portal protein
MGVLGSLAGSLPLVGGRTISYAQLYRTQVWIATNINKLSRNIARLPLKVFDVDPEGNRTPAHSGALYDLMRKPWQRGSGMDLRYGIAFPLALQGNSVFAKARANRGGPVTSMVPLDWRYLIPRLDAYQRVMYWETWQTGKQLFLDPADVVHFAWQAPDGDLGVSPLQQLGTTVRLEDSMQRYEIASFENAARPAGGLVVDSEKRVGKPERDELREEVEQAHGGIDNAFKIMVLGGGVDWKPFSQTAKDAELISSRKLTREEVAAVYDIPPPMIGILENATFSNISEQHKMLFTTILGPWLTLIEETLQAQLLAGEAAFANQALAFDLSDLLKGDPAKRVPEITKGIESGLYTINEGRQMEGLPPVDHPSANVPLLAQNNLRPLGSEDEEEGESEEEEEGEEGEAEAVASHIVRARDLTLTKLGAGATKVFDPDRFERELAADIDNDDRARELAASISAGIEKAGGDPAQVKQFFAALLAA